ncbi:MAG: hypothetical protein JSV77_01455 [Dehalococcoidales bacterium]|nr:MAG: hypothetical protein JSV77_01455 [Dehalococcoidales bacterium]
MCFSATASFVASGALVTSGVAIARIPKPKSAVPLSMFPVIFAILQFFEGLLWLNHRGFIADNYRSIAVYAFLLIAFVLWPIFVPFSVYILESGRIRRVIILLCQFAGMCAGLTNLVIIIRGPIDALVVGHSFAYVINIPDIISALYLISIIIPFLVSGNKGLVIFGATLAASSVTAGFLASTGTFPSVWCFFAAILSLFLYLFFRYSANRNRKIPATSSSS